MEQRRHRGLLISLQVASLGLLAACENGTLSGGNPENAGESTEESGDSELIDDTPGGVTVACGEDAELADNPLLKLSTTQYRNTVRDLLARFQLGSLEATVAPLLSSVPDDSLGEGFRGLDDRIGLEHVQGFFNVGVAVGDAIRNDPALIAYLGSACSAAPSDACWDDFVSGFLRAVYRRPLTEAELASYEALRAEASSEVEAIRAAVIVALSSPRFVYHVEIDGAAIDDREDLLLLDAYEVASRLSYTFWQTMPDDELLAHAASGALLDEETYSAELKRVWEDERSQATIEKFWIEWLKLEKFTGFETTRPAFIAMAAGTNVGAEGHDVYQDMVDEVVELTNLFTFTQPGSLAALLRTNVSVTSSADLAGLYGVSPWDGQSAYPTLPEGERAGLLQRGALLVSNLEQTNPFHRGALLRRAILCDPLPQPDPNDLPPGSLDPPPFNPAQTTRDRFEAKVEGNSLCEGCHTSFSPLGYVMESFDALGRYRTTEQVFDEQTGALLAELPIDTMADALVAAAGESPVTNAAELNERIAASGKVEVCMAKSYFEYVARRAQVNASIDSCVIDDLSEVLAQDDGGLAAAFQRMARVSTFFTKKVGAQ